MLPRKRKLIAAATTCVALAIPSVASAKDFCVGGPAGCTGTPVQAGGLKAELTAAQSNGSDDRFILAPGVYSADAFSHKSPERVQIIGAGADKTILRGNLAQDSTLWLEGNPDSSVSSLTVQATAGMLAGLVLQGTSAWAPTAPVSTALAPHSSAGGASTTAEWISGRATITPSSLPMPEP